MDADGLIDGLREEQLVEPEEIDGLVRDAVKQALGDNVFQHTKAEGWAAAVVEGCLKRLASAGKPFKYIVTTNLLQKAGGSPRLPPSLHPTPCMHCPAPLLPSGVGGSPGRGQRTLPFQN